jgi:hypothetical protein
MDTKEDDACIIPRTKQLCNQQPNFLSQSKKLQPTYYKWKQTSLNQDKEFLEY